MKFGRVGMCVLWLMGFFTLALVWQNYNLSLWRQVALRVDNLTQKTNKAHVFVTMHFWWILRKGSGKKTPRIHLLLTPLRGYEWAWVQAENDASRLCAKQKTVKAGSCSAVS